MSGWWARLVAADTNADATRPDPTAEAADDASPARSADLHRDASESARDRRRRDAAPAERVILDAIAQKTLHGWLQNRQQTLMPLSVNLARLAPDDRARLLQVAAIATRAVDVPAGDEAVARWLEEVGGDGHAVATYRDALTAPPPLDVALAATATSALAALAFVVTLVATREGGAAGRAFADYVAARLALPPAAIRSAERRFRF